MRAVRPTSLATRVAALCVAVALITGAVAAGLSIGLIQRNNESSARHTLAKLADTVQSSSDNAAVPQARARQTLKALNIQFAIVSAGGALSGGNALARRTPTPVDIRKVLAGAAVSGVRRVDGRTVLIEGRPAGGGGFVLVQQRSDATAVGDQAIRRFLLALGIAVVIAVVLGLLVAWRMSRPLRRSAEAAHALAAGRRDVRVAPEGPAEVAEMGIAINSLATALGQSEDRQRQFLLSVSHDLRTPLTAITGYAESLSTGVVPAEQAREVGAVLLDESLRLNRLVGDLLDLARLDAQQFRVDLVPVDLGEVISGAAQAWQGRCQAAGIALLIDAPLLTDSANLMVRTDAMRVRQVLDGLVENALRVTPSGRPIVLAGGPAADGFGVFEVRDGGPGLTDDDLSVAFDQSVLYDRYRGVRQVGTGLGLAIVKALVLRLDGHVEAGHAMEGGARFTVWLPLAAGTPADVRAQPPGEVLNTAMPAIAEKGPPPP